MEFTIERPGGLKDVSGAGSSEHHALDFGAVEAVRRAAPFETFIPQIGKRELAIRAPFRYG